MMHHTNYEYISRTERDTALLAERIAALADAGTVIALDGDLGAGKTTFSQALAKSLGVTDIVNSPTFTIIKEYEGTRYPFYHMDVYRISLEEAGELGLDDYFYGDGVTVVEWASIIEEEMPPERLAIQIEHDLEGGRRFRVVPFGAKYREWCEKLMETGVLS